MSTSAVAAIGQVAVVLGALVFSTAGLGLLRLRDVYARSSAIATAAGLGVSLILIGVYLLDPTPGNTVKLIVAIVLQLATSAIGSMAIARSAYLTGSPLVLAHPRADELAAAADPAGTHDADGAEGERR